MIIELPVGKYVSPDGKLLSSSASAIITSDETTPFGCLRKAWFEIRAGLKSESKSFDLGNQIHHQIEHYLKTGQDALGKEARAGKENIERVVRLFPVFQIEQWITELLIDDVKIRGRIDFKGRRIGETQLGGIVDWKSSSDIGKWSKTKNQLRKDTQMLIYRQDAENEGCDENLYMAHVYFGTAKRESEIVETSINREQLSAGMEDIQKKLAVLKSAVKEVDSYAVKGDKSKCGRCPYAVHCTDKQGVVSVMSSITDRFKKKLTIEDKSTPDDPPPATQSIATTALAAPKAEPKDEIAELKAKLAAAEAKASPVLEKTLAARVEQVSEMVQKQGITPQQAQKLMDPQAWNIITPPDQPKSDPKLAADPVPGFSPIPEPLKDRPPAPAEQHNTAAVPPVPAAPATESPDSKKGRGRPPGAKNKPKDELPYAPVCNDPAPAGGWQRRPDSAPITRVKVSLGATVKFNPEDPKCFEFIRADVGMERDVFGGDEEVKAARQKLADDCTLALVEELEKLKANTK